MGLGGQSYYGICMEGVHEGPTRGCVRRGGGEAGQASVAPAGAGLASRGACHMTACPTVARTSRAQRCRAREDPQTTICPQNLSAQFMKSMGI